ncbi:MAG: tyrosine-type recombinase/integrase [Chloroflexi bacterium]|uniref:Site-specific integrase n=1 Tax=Candidatus Chlorohelix allophototropha TaxID=3003348 RepID=A0A8T7M6H2_9CHLR|nr:tyrosine-type recombinase/integrase [Chloroflexota bacterium]WJW66127.1 site-specific integrase [Chloroflexota bacterium L227-S17]WJW69600.1 site-specific integrase [Chloroflexota bacterium L227-S17]
MKVQRLSLSGPDHQVAGVSWLLLDDNFLPVIPVQEFLSYLHNLERSPNTIRSYAHHLKLYWQYLTESQLDWSKVGLDELAAFVAWLRNPLPGIISLQPRLAKRSESTINTIVAVVSAFYDYQQRRGFATDLALYRSQSFPQRRYKDFLYHISKSKPVTTRLIKLKVPKRLPKTLTNAQVQQLLEACHNLRDRYLVSLLYQTGMRVGQALGLRHSDIHSWDNLIRIVTRQNNLNQARAKTLQPYSIHVSPELMSLYTRYLLDEFGDTDSDYVFVNLWEGAIGQPLHYESVIDLFHRLSKQTGLAVHPHMLRHTHATELFQNGWDAALVQKRLGHAQVQTTLNTYVHLTEADLKKAYQIYLERRAPRDE